MQVNSLGPLQMPELPGKSKSVPSGLQCRELELPPGIARKLEAGGTAPRGIINRFPAAAPPQSTPTDPAPENQDGDGAPTVDIVV